MLCLRINNSNRGSRSSPLALTVYGHARRSQQLDNYSGQKTLPVRRCFDIQYKKYGDLPSFIALVELIKSVGVTALRSYLYLSGSELTVAWRYLVSTKIIGRNYNSISVEEPYFTGSIKRKVDI